MSSKRIEKYLIDRDDTMHYAQPDGSERYYVDTHAVQGGINFSVSIFNNDVGDNLLATFYYESPLAIELAMRMIMPDLRKWRVLKNGR